MSSNACLKATDNLTVSLDDLAHKFLRQFRNRWVTDGAPKCPRSLLHRTSWCRETGEHYPRQGTIGPKVVVKDRKDFAQEVATPKLQNGRVITSAQQAGPGSKTDNRWIARSQAFISVDEDK